MGRVVQKIGLEHLHVFSIFVGLNVCRTLEHEVMELAFSMCTCSPACREGMFQCQLSCIHNPATAYALNVNSRAVGLLLSRCSIRKQFGRCSFSADKAIIRLSSGWQCPALGLA